MSFLYCLLRLILIAVFLHPLFVTAQDAVQLVFPPKVGKGTTLKFDPGQKVPLQWTCTFPMFTLQVWQGPDEEGTRAFRNLLTNITDTTVRSLSWSAETIAGFTNDIPMHVRVFNPEDKDCETCNVQSEDFFISQTAGNSTAIPTSSNSSTDASSNLGLALGLGLGLGISIAVAVTSIVTFCILRRRWREAEIRTADPYEAPLTTWKQPPPSTSPSSGPPSAGYYGPQGQRAETREPDGHEIAELRPDLMRVEADQAAERIELDGHSVRGGLTRKFSWQR